VMADRTLDNGMEMSVRVPLLAVFGAVVSLVSEKQPHDCALRASSGTGSCAAGYDPP
jgi:hypothetical protein